jgi:hypothetical protein
LIKRGIGINKTISISNTIKIIASKKNRIENGTRALWFGSNPHSKGDSFSREDEVVRILKIHANTYTKTGSNMATAEEIRRFVIN